MGWFDFLKPLPAPLPAPPPVPVEMDFTKRYDVYCTVSNEDRLYENVRFVGVRSLQWGGTYLEIETIDGIRMFITTFCIQMICEHGTQPTYKVLKTWSRAW